MSTPPKEPTRIQWIAEWDMAAREDPATPAHEDPAMPAREDPATPARKDPATPTREESDLFLLEEKAQVNLAQEGDAKDGVWYFDSGAPNHMTSDRTAFAELDTSIVGTVKFRDGSHVDICGQGTVLFICKSDEHRAVTGVYLITRLNTQIIGLGQLYENGY